MKLYSHLDLHQNELRNVTIQNRTSPPENPKEGQIYFNTVDKTFYGFKNGQWRDLAAEPALVRDFSQDIRQAVEDLKQELLGGAEENVNTLKKIGDIVKAVESLPSEVTQMTRKETHILSTGSNGVHTISHSLATEDVIVIIYNTDKEQILTDVHTVDDYTVEVIFSDQFDVTGYRVVIIG